MAKYMVVIRAESKYFRYLNKHKVTNVPSGRGRAGMRVCQFFLLIWQPRETK